MKIIAFHNREDIAALLGEVEAITQVKIDRAENIEEFKEKVLEEDYDAVVVLDDFFESAITVLLHHPKVSKTVCILMQDDERLNQFLRLGIAETNIEYIPFNPLTFLVKLKGLQSNALHIKEAIAKGHINFDFYRFGLLNVLNVFTSTDKNLFLSIKDAETDEVLYSLHLEKGQVVGANTDIERIIEINLDDSIPKKIVKDPLEYEDKVIFKDTAHFYNSLLKGKLVEGVEIPGEEEEKFEENLEEESICPTTAQAPSMEEVEETLEEVIGELEPIRIESIRLNPLREKRVYSFPYKRYLIFSQPYEGLGGGKNAVCVIPYMDSTVLRLVKVLKVKHKRLKFLTCPLIKNYLKMHGFTDENFAPTTDVAIYQFPFLSAKFECAFQFYNGILITGSLFGSFVSKNISYLNKEFLSHFRVFHRANISSKEKLTEALEALSYIIGNLQFIIPAFGYPIPPDFINTAKDELQNLEFPKNIFYIEDALDEFRKVVKKPFKDFSGFVQELKKEKPSTIFKLIEKMEQMEVVPFEF